MNSAEPRKPSVATMREQAHDVWHGTRVDDPYRWLEDGDSERVQAWTQEQNAHTAKVLGAITGREQLRGRIESMMSVGDVGSPVARRLRDGTWRYFYSKREGLQNQPVLFVRDGVGGTDRVLLDVNQLAQDGTISLDWYFPSSDGRLLAYGTSNDGDEESILRVREIAADGTHRDRDDVIPRTRHCSLAWKPDGSGFFYSRYPRPGDVPEGEDHYHRAIYEHRLGTDPSTDPKVFGDGRDMTDSPSVDLSPDGRWLLVGVFQGWAKSEVYVRDLRAKKAPFVPVVEGRDAMSYGVALNDSIYLWTNDGAPKGKLMRVDPRRPAQPNWQPLIPERQEPLDEFRVVGKSIFTTYLKDASSRVKQFRLDGTEVGEVPLPVLGSASIAAEHDSPEMFVRFSSFAVPVDVYRVPVGDSSTAEPQLWQRVSTPLDPAAYDVSQQWATSKDGTRVPYFTVRKKGQGGGPLPGLLTAYGGFNISLVPNYLRAAGAFIERGGVFVQANLRGGAEYGEDWHRAGMFERKQNVFDDMIAVAEDVKRRGIVATDRLAVMGGSNGGLLVGAMVTQRPELFKAAVARVPLMDMLRYQSFLIAKLWIPEYGTAEDEKLFPALLAYSPYHNVKQGTAYPAMLLASAESDSRVDPMHARKMAAALQHATSSSEPILLRIESKAGHGAGKPISKQIDEFTDVYSFILWKLGMMQGAGNEVR